jgi:hypothetical protein
LDEKDPWGPFSSSDVYALCSTFHTTLKGIPVKLGFGRDMRLPITFVADLGQVSNNAKKKCLVIIEEKMLPE